MGLSVRGIILKVTVKCSRRRRRHSRQGSPPPRPEEAEEVIWHLDRLPQLYPGHRGAGRAHRHGVGPASWEPHALLVVARAGGGRGAQGVGLADALAALVSSWHSGPLGPLRGQGGGAQGVGSAPRALQRGQRQREGLPGGVGTAAGGGCRGQQPE